MLDQIEAGFMVFLADGAQGIGAVRHVLRHGVVIYIEGSGEFTIPETAIREVHSQKVMLNAEMLDAGLVNAMKHSQIAEDPSLAG